VYGILGLDGPQNSAILRPNLRSSGGMSVDTPPEEINLLLRARNSNKLSAFNTDFRG
jgi:hypothetical protein